MSIYPSTYHQQVKDYYKSLFSQISIYNKKGNARAIVESIVNFGYIKYFNTDLSKENRQNNKKTDTNRIPSVTDRIKELVRKDRIKFKYQPSLFFVYNEGNFGSHPDSTANHAGEESFIEAVKICLTPIIKDFFLEEGLDTSFLKPNTPELISDNTLKEKESKPVDKKNTILLYSTIAAVALFLGTVFYTFSLRGKVSSSQNQITEFQKKEDNLKKEIESKRQQIETLNTTISSYKIKDQSGSNGIKNNFNGNVEKVANFNKPVEKVTF